MALALLELPLVDQGGFESKDTPASASKASCVLSIYKVSWKSQNH